MSYGIRSVTAVSISFQEIGGYDPVYLRPWEMAYSEREKGAFVDALGGASQVTVGAMARVAHHLIKPSVRPYGAAEIANGWETQRFRFCGTFEMERLDGDIFYCEVQGYTDYLGITGMGDQIDPKMVLHINSLTNLYKSVRRTPTGSQAHARVLNSCQAVNTVGEEDTYALRPEDIARKVQLLEIGDSPDERSNGQISMAMDLTSKITAEGALSNRSNQVASSMLVRTLNPFFAQTLNPEGPSETYNLIEEALPEMRSTSVTSDQFISYINGDDRFNYSRRCNEITWGDLCYKIPNALRVTTVLHLDSRQRMGLDRPGMYQGWNNTLPETIFADQVLKSLPALMGEYYLNTVAFTVSNYDTGNGQAYFAWSQAPTLSVPGLDELRLATGFENRILMELYAISRSNLIGYHLEVFCSADGMFRCKLGIEGASPLTYAAPVLADSLFPPVLTTNPNHLQNLAAGFNDLYTVVQDYVASHNTRAPAREAARLLGNL